MEKSMYIRITDKKLGTTTDIKFWSVVEHVFKITNDTNVSNKANQWCRKYGRKVGDVYDENPLFELRVMDYEKNGRPPLS